MTMGFGLRLSLPHSHKVQLTLAQRHAVQLRQMQLRQELVQSLRGRGERMIPRAVCPQCSHLLTPLEIMRGFLDDPHDTTTACSECGERFQPTLETRTHDVPGATSFWCPAQTLSALRELGAHEPDFLRKSNSTIYYSAIVHFGSIAAAFCAIGIEYTHDDEIVGRDERIVPFLGLLPDTVIASVARMSVSTVRRKRWSLGIERYRRSLSLY